MGGIAASLVRMLASATRRTTGEVPVREVPAPCAATGHIAKRNKPRPPVRGSLAWHEVQAAAAWAAAEKAQAEGDMFLAACLYDCWRLNVETIQARRAVGPVTIPL